MPKDYINLLPSGDILRYEELVEIVRIASDIGINKIRITGGEPLVRRDIPELINALNSVTSIERLSLTTNGTLLKDNVEPLYKAGLRELNVSLDTLKRDRFIYITKKDLLPQVIDGIYAALKIGFLVKLNVVVMRGVNDDELLDFAGIIRETPIFVRFIELMPIGDTGFYTQGKFISIETIKERCESLASLYPVEGAIGSGPAAYYRFRDSAGALGFIGAISKPFCKDCNRLRLTSYGFLKVCLDSDRAIDLKPALRPRMNRDYLETLFRYALTIKPKAHSMSYQYQSQIKDFSMCGIGG